MKPTKPSLSINLDLIKEGELRYFFRPFFWKTMDYSILWEEKTPVPISSVNLKTTHEDIIEAPKPSITPVTEISEESMSEVHKEELKVDTPSVNEETPASSKNDILASYRDIAKRYKS